MDMGDDQGKIAADQNGGLPRSFLNLLFSWSLRQILNHNLYKDKVKNLPLIFSSLEQYLGSFVDPFVEEMRSEISSSIDLLSHAPVFQILEIEELKPTCEMLYKLLIKVPEDVVDSGAKRYTPQNGDLFALSSVRRPRIAGDLDRGGVPYTLAIITGFEGDELSPHLLIPVRASKHIYVPKGRGSLFAVFLVNLTTYLRIWQSMSLEMGTKRNLNIIKNTLYTDFSGDISCTLCSFGLDGGAQKKNICGDLCSFGLNESQKDAVLSSLSLKNCNHVHSIKLIWGPPGTGKTKTVCTLLWSLLGAKHRTLTCAPTNVAVLQIASRLIKMVKESCPANSSVGDIVLSGNKSRMKIEGDLEEIFLQYRVECLSECFSPHSGWNHQLSQMLDFLKECGPRYQQYLEEKKKDENAGEPLTFREFLDEKIDPIMMKLNKYVGIFSKHLSSTFLPRWKSETMFKTLNLLQKFGNLLLHDASDRELEVLLASETSSSLLDKFNSLLSISDSMRTELCKARSNCIEMLEHLKETLKIPNIKKREIEDFCLANATIIFCTAPGSFRLRKVEMTPLEFLIIDEAAQLKECESLIPLQLLGLQHAILIGDECQMSAMVRSKVSENAGFGRSLFQRMVLLGHQKHLLDVQYRMHPSISIFPNESFYNKRILDGENVKDKAYEKRYLSGRMYGPYSFLNIACGKEIFDYKHSRKNMTEVAVVVALVESLYRASSCLKHVLSVGIISPYTAQVSALQEGLAQIYPTHNGLDVQVKSIDGFQGSEQDIIIISTVRSNASGSIGFLSNLQRTNVALTRAKHCLWVLGNGPTLTNSGSIWKKVVVDAKNRGCFYNVDEDESLVNAIVQANIQSNEIDDLLDSLTLRKAKWKILFTDDFKKSFGRIREKHICIELIEFMKKLADGVHPEKHEFVGGGSFEHLKQYDVKGQGLFWSVELLRDTGYMQVLKFWDTLPLSEAPRLVKRLDIIFSKYTWDYITKCKSKSTDGKLDLPMSWNTGAADQAM